MLKVMLIEKPQVVSKRDDRQWVLTFSPKGGAAEGWLITCLDFILVWGSHPVVLRAYYWS